ncbi:MAG: hypothetical protein FJW64_15715 [Actinobacteria bacterium]|nr:hypothetical protein [Actinomycetota bacterium]
MDDVALTHRICELLGRVPGWSWEPADDAPDYLEDVVGIRYGETQPTPHRTIGVRVYWTDDDALNVRRVQLRFRGRPNDPAGADSLAGVAFVVLHGLSRVGGISDIRRVSSGPLGSDTKDRRERSDNYQIILDNPEALHE